MNSSKITLKYYTVRYLHVCRFWQIFQNYNVSSHNSKFVKTSMRKNKINFLHFPENSPNRILNYYVRLTSKLIKTFKLKNEIYLLDWPDNLPKVNPAENSCKILNRRLCKTECTTLRTHDNECYEGIDRR